MRVVSLLPSATDIVEALQCSKLLVGRSHECDAAGTSSVRVCTEPKLGPTSFTLSHRDIHEAISALHASAAWQLSDAGVMASLCDPASEALNDDRRFATMASGHPEPSSEAVREPTPSQTLPGHLSGTALVPLSSPPREGSSAASPPAPSSVPPSALLLVEWFLSPYRILTADLITSRPDIILTQLQPEPGILDPQHIKSALSLLLGYHPTVVHLDPQSLDEALADVARIASTVQHEEQGRELIGSMRQRMLTVQKMCSGRPRRRVLCVQWLDPIFLAGAWVPELIRLAGGEPERNGEMIGNKDFVRLTQRCTSVLFALCGSSLAESVDAVRKQFLPSLPQVTQAQGGHAGAVTGETVSGYQLVVVEASKNFSRFGPTLVASLEVLAEALHPEIQSFGHREAGWVSL